MGGDSVKTEIKVKWHNIPLMREWNEFISDIYRLGQKYDIEIISIQKSSE